MKTTDLQDQLTAQAADAVKAWYAERHDDSPHYGTEHTARQAIDRALRMGATAAQIASLAGVRQLLVAQLVEDDERRAAALAAARHDADRHAAEAHEALRREALRMWAKDSGHGAKARIRRDLRIAQPTLEKWIAAAN